MSFSINLLIKLLTPLFLRGLHNQESHVRNFVATVKLFSLYFIKAPIDARNQIGTLYHVSCQCITALNLLYLSCHTITKIKHLCKAD